MVNGAANADVGVTTIADTLAPLVGEPVTFTVTVTNRGPSPATGVAVTDALPAGLTLVEAIPSEGTYVAPTWTIGTLSETGPPVTLTLVATVTAPGALVNTATITQRTELDPNAANDSASVTLNAAESANLKVTKALTRSSPHVGELLTFHVIVANQGPSPATGVAVTEVLSAGLAFDSAVPSQGAYNEATGVWTVGALANGGSAGLTITARVTQAGTVTNTATVTASDQPDPDPTDNSSSVTLTTETIADLAITKTLTGTYGTGTRHELLHCGDQHRAESGDRCERERPVPGGPCRPSVDLHRRPWIELRRGRGYRQSRHDRHARGRRSRHIHRNGPDLLKRDRPARQHGDRHTAGRRR